MTDLLTAEHLRYYAGEAALISDVSLSLDAGEVLAVVGPNGAGKSTLLRLVAGDLTPQAGSILLEGRALQRYSPLELAQRRAVMPQQALIQFAFQVEQVVTMGRYPHHHRRDLSPREEQQIVEHALQRTEMLPLRARAYPTLSGGEAARTLLARALAQETRLVLLDEPTASLDIRHQELVMRIARALAANGKAVLMVLHDLNLAAAYADRLALLHRGRLAALGSPLETLTAPLLSEIYGYPVYVTTHPRRNCPLVLADSTPE
jgi:iron complex transport system ATP-binding protein